MSKILKEISIIAGQYKNEDGVQKNRYQRIGSIIETKFGGMLKLDQIPLIDGGWNGWAYINEPRQEEQSNQRQDNQRQGDQRKSDDVPF